MGPCQLIRKETKMDVVPLNQKKLAARWNISEATLEAPCHFVWKLTASKAPV